MAQAKIVLSAVQGMSRYSIDPNRKFIDLDTNERPHNEVETKQAEELAIDMRVKNILPNEKDHNLYEGDGIKNLEITEE